MNAIYEASCSMLILCYRNTLPNSWIIIAASWEDSSIPCKKDVWNEIYDVGMFSGHLFPVVLLHFPESARVNRCKRTFRCRIPQLIRSSVQKTVSVHSTAVLVSKAFEY